MCKIVIIKICKQPYNLESIFTYTSNDVHDSISWNIKLKYYYDVKVLI